MPHCETPSPVQHVKIRGGVLRLDRPLVMGVLNVTPDSFSDGGLFLDPEVAVARACDMVQEGADVLDIGAESSRPGADPVEEQEELRRLMPVLEAVCRRVTVPVSVDTTKATVARRAIDAGARIINDVSALRFDGAMASVIAETGAGVVLMHMQGTPKTMQISPHYDDVVPEVRDFFVRQVQTAVQAGISEEQVILDPGIGFGKRLEDSLTLLAQLDRLLDLRCPILVGVSRKGFIGQILGRSVNERLFGTAAACAAAILKGARIIRVHDVRPMRELVGMLQAILERQP
jgi:dihydropteroate synthase